MDLLEGLGLSGRRVLLLHHDDLGLTHAQNGAYQALGLPPGSVMVPGAWAGGVRGRDLGVHLTLTSEWPAPKMRPLTEGESLRDEAGFFPSSPEALWQRARAEEVERELRAQIEAAKRLFPPLTWTPTRGRSSSRTWRRSTCAWSRSTACPSTSRRASRAWAFPRPSSPTSFASWKGPLSPGCASWTPTAFPRRSGLASTWTSPGFPRGFTTWSTTAPCPPPRAGPSPTGLPGRRTTPP